MRLPVITGVIDRRILANWRCDPDVLARLLPAPFRPKLVGVYGVAGVCLIRLAAIRPKAGWVPAALGVGSENAAHRIAVEWEEAAPGGRAVLREGVYIPRRDTSSRFNTLVGGRLFPGVHHHATFDVTEADDRIHVAVASDDGVVRLSIDARVTAALPPSSLFADLQIASAFFERGACGYSPGRRAGEIQGLELRTRRWQVEPLAIEHTSSTYFDDAARFPPRSAELDCALLMRGIEHECHDVSGPVADPATFAS